MQSMFSKLQNFFGVNRHFSDQAQKLMSEADAAMMLGDWQSGLDLAIFVLQRHPNLAAAHHLVGVAYSNLGKRDDAFAYLAKAVNLYPTNARFQHDFGIVLAARENLQDAELAYRQACRLDPKNPLFCRSLGKFLIDQFRPKEALGCLRLAAELAPKDLSAQELLGRALYSCFDFQSACAQLESVQRNLSLSLDGKYFLACSMQMMRRYSDAELLFREVLELVPEAHLARLMLSFNRLYQGDWDEGFALYESRMAAAKSDRAASAYSNFFLRMADILGDVPLWKSGGCKNKRLLIWFEQGLGDGIMLLRLLPTLTLEYGAKSVTLLAPAALENICRSLPGVKTISSSINILSSKEDYDAHCSIMSLPYLVGLMPDSIPNPPPYIQIPSNKILYWKERLATYASPRVGIVWAGGGDFKLDEIRSLRLLECSPFFGVDGITFFSLQKDFAARNEIHETNLHLVDLMDDCSNFEDTAALMMNLDLVISVDTSIAHLAGALGCPVWLFNRFESEWRWMQNRCDSVWYPSMRIFTQPTPRDWQSVVQEMVAELKCYSWPVRSV